MGLGLGLALATAAAAEEAAPPKVQAGSDGFSLASADGAWKLRLYGYGQVDGRFGLGDDSGAVTDTFALRRFRPSIEVTVGERFEATFVPELAGGNATVADAYVEVHHSAALRLRAGKFKVPLAFERLHSGSATLFGERSLASGLVPNRDVGVQLLGQAGRAQYALALLNGGPDGGSSDVDGNDAKDVAARLFVRPFREARLSGLGLGFGATVGRQRAALPGQRTAAQATYFQWAAGTTADGSRHRLAPQVTFISGRFGGFAEYVLSSQQVRRGDAAERVALSGWTVNAAFVLTGEKSGLGRVTPSRPFDPKHGGRGAWELAVRASGFDAEEAVFDSGFADPARAARSARGLGVGLNWYLTKNVRQQLGYERTAFDGGAAAGDRETEHALSWRLQLAF